MRLLQNNVRASILAKEKFLKDDKQLKVFADIVKVLVKIYKNGGRLYIAGNGGSAADAQHLAAEFVSKLAKPRHPLPAEALTTDTSILTAIGNDYGFEKVFSRQIEGKVTEDDAFLAITTSGKSKNILEALNACSARDITTILLTGYDGGLAINHADYCLIAPGEQTSTIQEVHQVIYHSLCESVEAELFP
jgi:D-sedoheptulose 7-phosphate isomerase